MDDWGLEPMEVDSFDAPGPRCTSNELDLLLDVLSTGNQLDCSNIHRKGVRSSAPLKVIVLNTRLAGNKQELAPSRAP